MLCTLFILSNASSSSPVNISVKSSAASKANSAAKLNSPSPNASAAPVAESINSTVFCLTSANPVPGLPTKCSSSTNNL